MSWPNFLLRLSYTLAAAILLAQVAACAHQPDGALNLAARETPRTLPRPQMSTSAGTLVGVPLSPFQGLTRAEQAFDIMQSGGANFIEIRKRWADLEQSAGRVDLAIEPFLLFEKARKSHPILFSGFVVNLQVVDTSIRTMPADLAKKEFDDPVVLDRFDQVIVKLADYHKRFPVQYVIVGHEADIYLTRHLKEAKAFETFFRRAVERIHGLMPGVGVGTSMTFDMVKGNKSLFDNINQHSDLIVYTYYPLGSAWQMRPLDEVKSDLQLLVARAGGKNFALLEVGYSANPLNGGSDDKQATFVETVFRTLDPYRISGQLKFLEYWMMFDFPPDQSLQVARAQGSTDKRFVAYLSSLGLRRYDAGGAKRPAWDVFSALAKSWTTGQPLPKS